MDVHPHGDGTLAWAHQAMAAERSPACLLDPRLHILAVNAAWDGFARANGGAPSCLGAAVVGTSYPQHVEGAEPRAAIERGLAGALAGRRLSFDSECNTPDRVRHLRSLFLPLRASDPGPIDGVLVVHATLLEGPLERARAGGADEPTYRGEDGLVAMCSSCRRTRRALSLAGWDYVPAFVAKMPAGTTHVICPACAAQYGVSPADVTDLLTAERRPERP